MKNREIGNKLPLPGRKVEAYDDADDFRDEVE